MARTAALLLAVLALPAAGLKVAPFTGCKKALLQGDPADSKTIEGDDCGNVNQIVGKWAKSKKVGQLNGKAQAAINSANRAAKNTDDATARAEALGEKVGLKGAMPEGVKTAAAVAKTASTAATDAASSLKTTSDTFKGKFADFAKDISDADIIKIQKETEAAMVAAGDAAAAADRVMAKADEAKAAALKDTKGALALIGGLVDDATKLSTTVADVVQKSGFATKDVDAMAKKVTAAEGKLDKKIGDAKEQAPVWEAYKADLKGRSDAVDASRKDVDDAIKELKTADTAMKEAAKTLQGVADKAQSSQSAALNQGENIGNAEESIRATDTAFAALKGKVGSMMKDVSRLTDKLTETNKRLGA